MPPDSKHDIDMAVEALIVEKMKNDQMPEEEVFLRNCLELRRKFPPVTPEDVLRFEESQNIVSRESFYQSASVKPKQTSVNYPQRGILAYKAMKVPELKEVLKERGMRVSGQLSSTFI